MLQCVLKLCDCSRARIDLNNVIKVADFGLTEDIYLRGVTQHKNGKSSVKLPVKWMALESLNDGIFSEKSDVVRPPFNSSPSLDNKCFVSLCSGHLE